MVSEGSLQCSQEPAEGHDPEADETIPYTHTSFKIHFNIVLSPSPKSSTWSLSLSIQFSDADYVFTPSPCLLHAQPISSSLFVGRVQDHRAIFSHFSLCFFPVRSTYLLSTTFLSNFHVSVPTSGLIQTSTNKYAFAYFNFCVLIRQRRI
jgi:hypothetical protein